jgi:superfamily II DNA helicase RecQ
MMALALHLNITHGGYMLRIFTLEFDLEKNTFDDTELVKFQVQVKVLSIEKHFFEKKFRQYWTFAVEYEPKSDKTHENISLIDDKQKELYRLLRAWRNQLAESKHLPSYMVLRNNPLKRIIIANPCTIEEMNQIPDLGKRKIEEYGEDILNILRGFGEMQRETGSEEPF